MSAPTMTVAHNDETGDMVLVLRIPDKVITQTVKPQDLERLRGVSIPDTLEAAAAMVRAWEKLTA